MVWCTWIFLVSGEGGCQRGIGRREWSVDGDSEEFLFSLSGTDSIVYILYQSYILVKVVRDIDMYQIIFDVTKQAPYYRMLLSLHILA